MQADAVLNTFEALLPAEPDIAKSFLLAAVYARAIHLDVTPQCVVDDLFKVVPGDETWAAFREGLLAQEED